MAAFRFDHDGHAWFYIEQLSIQLDLSAALEYVINLSCSFVVVNAGVLTDFNEMYSRSFFRLGRESSFCEATGAILTFQLFEVFNFISFFRHDGSELEQLEFLDVLLARKFQTRLAVRTRVYNG